MTAPDTAAHILHAIDSVIAEDACAGVLPSRELVSIEQLIDAFAALANDLDTRLDVLIEGAA